MRNTIIATSLMILVGVSSVGCKSMPKTANTGGAETASLANTEPTKPSVLAKQAEGLAAATAPAFVPNLSTTPPAVLAAAPARPAYPSTDAPTFSQAAPASTATQHIAAATPPAGLGSIQLPYNPDAVPPAVSSTAETAAPAAAAPSRYAAASSPTSTLPTSTNPTAGKAPQTASRYGSYLATVQAAQQAVQAPSTANLPPEINGVPPKIAQATAASANLESSLSTPTAGSMEEIATNAAASIASRYTQSTPRAYTPSSPVSAAVTAPTTPTPQAVASTTPYRPGGTSSYPTTNFTTPSMIATRPESPRPQSPSVEAPVSSGQVPYPVTPQVPRYR